TAAQGIFGIDASEINLPQAAYLAGLPQRPSYYTPVKNNGGLKNKKALQPGINRMKTVLERMYDSEYITKEQYKKAMNYDITSDFTEKPQSPAEKYPYLTYEAEKRASNIRIQHVAQHPCHCIVHLHTNHSRRQAQRVYAD